jgi:hypothetical protein
MSGYLQRIASGVLHSQRAIHPDVGSLWMPQRNAVPSEQFNETMAPIVPRRSTQPDAQQTRSALAHMSNKQEPDPPLQDLSARRQDASIPVESRLEPEHPPLVVRDATMTQAREGQNADAAAPRATFTPLVATPSHESLPQPRTFTPASTPVRERLQRTVQLTPPATPQPDEIEIHIGRIEVAAVLPQPAPRLPARPVRKSLDLSEYLKRDRRSR